MARIPQSFIDELISRVDIVEVIDKRVPLKKQGREFVACCPFHNEKTPSFSVSPVKQFFHCFGCGAHGTALGFLMDYEHLDFLEAVRQLASLVGTEVPLEAGETRADYAPLYGILDKAAGIYRDALKHAPGAIDYLKGRGLTGEIAAEFAIGFAPAGWDTLLKALGSGDAERQILATAGLVIRKDDGRYYDRFRERIMFPIRDSRGRIIAFGGRVIGKDEPKYLNSPETPLFHKGRELYGLYEARQVLRDIPRLLVVEGYMDVVALHQHGVRYAVATLGTATTAEHLKKLFRISPEVVFCFDGDRAGRAAAWRALENTLPEAHEGRQIRFLFLPEGEDPDTLVRKEGKQAFEARLGAQAMELSNFLFKDLLDHVDTRDRAGRARLAEVIAPYLARIPAGPYRQMVEEEATKLAGVPIRIPANGRPLSMLIQGSPKQDVIPASGRSGSQLRLTSPVRKAIALLLNRPGLAALAGAAAALEGLNLKGVEVLQALLEFAQAHPHITGAGLLEHWRDTETGSYLMKLAQAELVTPADAMESEFRAVMADLQGRRPAEQRLAQLMQASRERTLHESEKAELARLLKARPGSRGGPEP
ncbi:MAG: DNA primase [Gammaproteobacteria bacterium]